MSQIFPKSLRLLRPAQFRRVYNRNLVVSDAVLVLRGCENGLDRSRLGLTVSRKVGNAVVRNRWKRVLREAFRRSQTELPVGLDLIASPRRGAQPDAAAVAKSLPQLTRRIAGRIARAQRCGEAEERSS